MIQEENFKNLCDLTTSLVGLPKGSLSLKSRKLEYHIPRSAVSVIARMVDKTHQNVIAKQLNRDRSLIYHYEKTHDANYKTFPKYRKVFNKIYNAYSNLQGDKRTFENLNDLKRQLKANGVFNNFKHQTTLRITSGKVQADIKVSYKDFYKQLENCKLALTNCNYNIEII
jgi:hypothetical protein|tara:strand:+ start:1109 stop:1618 length:510 start_codon:yes stop_codon:yes gene_type:complete